MDNLMGISELDNLIGEKKLDIFGTKTNKYLTIASIDIETNSLDIQGDILSFGYVIGKFYYDENKPTEKASPVAEGKYIVGFEPIIKDELFFYYSGLTDVGRTDIHGITLDMLKPHADKFQANLCKMASICSSYITIAKNGWKFDMPFIVTYLLKNNMVLDADNINMIEEQDVISPVWKKENGFEGTKRIGKLGEYVDWLNNKVTDNEFFTFKAHNALEDAFATSWCYYRFMRGMY